jgi:hypothetical protein
MSSLARKPTSFACPRTRVRCRMRLLLTARVASEIFLRSWRQTALSSATVVRAKVSEIAFAQTTGDWAYDALVPIAGFEFILGLAVAVSVIRRGHGLFPLRSHKYEAPRMGGSSDEHAHLVSLICDMGRHGNPFPALAAESLIRLGGAPTVAMLDACVPPMSEGFLSTSRGFPPQVGGAIFVPSSETAFVTSPSRRASGSAAC